MINAARSVSVTIPIEWYENLQRDVRAALEGDSNDAEHDALVDCARALGIYYKVSDE